MQINEKKTLKINSIIKNMFDIYKWVPFLPIHHFVRFKIVLFLVYSLKWFIFYFIIKQGNVFFEEEKLNKFLCYIKEISSDNWLNPIFIITTWKKNGGRKISAETYFPKNCNLFFSVSFSAEYCLIPFFHVNNCFEWFFISDKLNKFEYQQYVIIRYVFWL